MPVVRRAVVGDADAIGSVHVRAWQAGYRGQMSDEFLDGLSIEDRQHSWRAGLTEGPGDRTVVVVEDPADGHVCGFAVVGDPRDRAPAAAGDGELWAINLEPEAWGRALGAALLAGAVVALQGRGSTEAHLWVLEANARARRFYEREGWAADGGVKDEDFGGRSLREVRYRRGLTGPPARD
jgi:ribosomal protein S18 acetylase RimI-like enzyme